MALQMRPKRGKQPVGAPRGRQWSRRGSARPQPGRGGLVLLSLFVLTLVVAAAIAAFAWAMDFQLRRGLLAQRAEAAARPDWVPLGALPPYTSRAFLLVVDPLFPARRSWQALTEPTLARQLVREVHLLGDGLAGEARALVMAPLVEYHLPNQAILELYLNRVYLGDDEEWRIAGIYHAARDYFDKDPRELTLSEAATLAGLLLPPRLERPHLWPGAVGARRNEVLRQMLAEGSITAADHQAALQEPLHFQAGPEHAPMTRPPDWQREPVVIRLPATLPQAAEPGLPP